MGHAIFARSGRDKSSESSLRDAINEFTYQDPNTLPDDLCKTDCKQAGRFVDICKTDCKQAGRFVDRL
jgi:hypothetical protein